MNRETYLQHRKSGDIVSICYLYYLEKQGKSHLSRRDFGVVFNLYIMNIEGNMVINDFIMRMDKSFNINILTDINKGNLITVY